MSNSRVVVIGAGNSGNIALALGMSLANKHTYVYSKEPYSITKRQVLIISDLYPKTDLINLTRKKRKIPTLKEHGWYRIFEKTNKAKNKSHPLGSPI